MQGKKIRLGSKIRQFRQTRQLNLKRLAELTSIAQSTLSKIENDVISPGFDKVMQICHALNIDITDLIKSKTESEADRNCPSARLSVSRKGDKATIATDNYDSNYVCSSISKKTMIPLIADLKIREGEEADIKLIRHPGEEYVYVIEGRVKVVLEHYQPVYLDQGDSLYIDSMMGHLYVNAGDANARIVGVSLSMDDD